MKSIGDEEAKLLLASAILVSLIAPATAQNGITLYDDTNFNANGNNITNFFGSACPSGQVVTQIYRNGSYSCVDVDSVSDSEPAPEGLPETLAANNTANQSIDFDGNEIDNLSELNPSGGNLELGSNLTLDGQGTLARVNEFSDLPISPVVDDWDDGDIQEYDIKKEDDAGTNSVSASTASGINDSSSTEITFETSFGANAGSVYRDSVFERGDTLTGFLEWTDVGPNDPLFGVGFGVQSSSDVKSDTDTYQSGYVLEVDYQNNNLTIYKDTKLESSSLSESVSQGTPYKFKIDWMRNGSIKGSLYDMDGNKLGEVHTVDSEYNEGIYSVIAGYQYTSSENSQAFQIDDFKITDSDGIDIDAPVSFENNTISDIKRLNNFFDQNQCASDEAVKTIYPNGSYACSPINTTSGAEGLNETLNAGAAASDQTIKLEGDSAINMTGGNLTNIGKLSLGEGSSDFRLTVGGEEFLDHGFEDGVLAPFQNDSANDANWSINDSSKFGAYSAQAGNTGDNEVSVLQTTVDSGKKVAFRYKFSQANVPGYSSIMTDYAQVDVAGETKTLPGTGGEWRLVGFEVPKGQTQFKWRLKGGNYGGYGDSLLKIDNVRVFNTTEDAVSVYGSLQMNTGDINAIDEAEFVEGVDIGGGNASLAGDIAIGGGSKAVGEAENFLNAALAIGQEAVANEPQAIALGENAIANKTSSMVLGTSSTAGARESIAIGVFAETTGKQSVSITPRGDYVTSQARAENSIAIGSFGTAGGKNSMALTPGGTRDVVNAQKEGSVAIGYNATAPNKYEATFGNLNSNELDVNVTGNLTVHGEEVDLKNGSINNFFNQGQCSSGKVVQRVYSNGSYKCVDVDSASDQTAPPENLSETLAAGNVANQSIDLDDNNLRNVGYLSSSEEPETVDGFEDGDMSEYYGDEGFISGTAAKEGDEGLELEGVGFASSKLGKGLDYYPKKGDRFEFYSQLTGFGYGNYAGLLFGLENTSDSGTSGYMVRITSGGFELVRVDSGAITVLDSEGSPNASEWYKFETTWQADGQMTVDVYRSGTRVAVLKGQDENYSGRGIAMKYYEGGPAGAKGYFDGIEVLDKKVMVNDSLGVSENLAVGGNISNFFNQGQCSSGKVVQRVYSNGSYKCVDVDTASDSGPENLSETLSAGNEAGDNNLNMSGNNVTDVQKVETEEVTSSGRMCIGDRC